MKRTLIKLYIAYKPVVRNEIGSTKLRLLNDAEDQKSAQAPSLYEGRPH